MDTKTTLEKRLEDIEHEIDKLDKRADVLRLQINELKFGVKIGQEIVYDGKKGIVESFYSGLWVIIRPYKKDGTLSSKVMHCYNFKELETK